MSSRHIAQTMFPRFTLAQLFFRLYHHPDLLHGQGGTHERAFESLLRTHTHVSYERHPCGPQRWPDFRLYVQGMAPLSLELKTTTTTRVHLGQTWPSPESIYLVSYQAHRGIYVGKGRHLLPSEQKTDYLSYVNRMNRLPRPSAVHARALLRVSLPLHLRDQHFQEVMDDLLKTPLLDMPLERRL